ncbi:MAG: ABC transporter ATP-binding protein [Planctomycetes bacterium]|nr:ABC transporter ATP-binding protein [Planctomycetota bacterium]
MIRLDRVTKNYGRKVAVRDLSLEVPPGELFAFLGPNGAGKTTTVKMIVGLLRPTEGRVTVGGHDLQKEYLAAKRILAYVPDQPYLYDKLSGYEFLNFIGDMYDIPRSERRREIDRWSDLFGMREYLNLLTESYSHGMKQRVVLAATLLHRPKVIVLDEPLVGLDPHSARLVKEVFRDQARAGATVFMSTHVLSIAEDVAQRIGIIRDGRLAALGTLEDLRRRTGRDGRLEDLYFSITDAASPQPN